MDNPPETYNHAAQRPRGFQLRGDIAISLAFHKGDWDGAQALMDIIVHQEPLNHVDIVLSISGGPESLPEEEWRTFHKKAQGFFRKVDINRTPILHAQKVFVPGTDQSTRDWRPNNKTFRGVVDYFGYFRKDIGAFFYLEPDCVILKRDWFSQLCSEYKSSKKPFMGVIRTAVNSSNGTAFPKHMNGSGFYPNPVSDHSQTLYVAALNTDALAAPFDVAGGSEVVPRCHVTKLLYVDFSATPNINPEAVIWHGDKQNHYKFSELEKLGIVTDAMANSRTECAEEQFGKQTTVLTGEIIDRLAASIADKRKNCEIPKNAYEAYLVALSQHGHDKAAWMRAVKKYKSETI